MIIKDEIISDKPKIKVNSLIKLMKNKLIIGLLVVGFLTLSTFLVVGLARRREINLLQAETAKEQATLLPSPITKKVLVLNFDPYISGTTPVATYYGWNNFATLQTQYVADVKAASSNYVNYQIVDTQTIRDFPVKASGFKFTSAQFMGCMTDSTPSYCFETVDYLKLINDYNLCSQVASGVIDEVWLWGGPYFGYYEFIYGGPDTPGIPNVGGSCPGGNKLFPIMGFSASSPEINMLHDLGHRSEWAITSIYGYYPYDLEINLNNPWSKYTVYDQKLPGEAGCGNVHFPPNGVSDYDDANQTYVNSNCQDWLNYPYTTGTKLPTNCSAWGCTDFEKYWLSHLPHATGSTDGKLNNWWAYIVDYDNAIKGLVPSPSPDIAIFADVPMGAFAREQIETIYNAGITGGCSTVPLNYCPNDSVTRAQMAVFLLRAKNGSSYSPPPATGDTFGDVPANGFAAAWIEQLVREGITSGCGAGNYCPNNSVTRAQMAVFLVKTFNLMP